MSDHLYTDQKHKERKDYYERGSYIISIKQSMTREWGNTTSILLFIHGTKKILNDEQKVCRRESLSIVSSLSVPSSSLQ